MTRRVIPCSQCGTRRATCRGLCDRCDKKSAAPNVLRVDGEDCDGQLFVKELQTRDGYGVFRGAHNSTAFFEPVLVEAHATEGEAERKARAMLRDRDPATTERIVEEWKRGHRKAWAA